MITSITHYKNNLDITKAFVYLFAILLLCFHSILFANVAMAQELTPFNSNSIRYYCPDEQRDVTILLDVNKQGVINGSMWMNINSIVTAQDASARHWDIQVEIAKRHMRNKLKFLTGNSYADIDIEFPRLQQVQQKSRDGYELVNFSFSKRVRGVWEINVPQDMTSLNIEMFVGRKAQTSTATSGESLTLII